MTRDSNGPIEALGFRLLLKNQQHSTISRKCSALGEQERGAKSWEKDQQRAKGANLFLAKQYQLHISNARKGIVL